MIVIGGGPAGAAAAISGCREGAEVRLYEQSFFPRHKVCGEFLSPEAMLVFERLGLAGKFQELRPWAVREANVSIGRVTKKWKLAEPAFGLSRFALDQFLLEQARAAGAVVVRERADVTETPTVVARGRHQKARTGGRTFGFKAHFSGPVNDRIDLLFGRDMYVGINCVENGITNVCGLATEQMLRSFAFEPDELMAANPALAQRLAPLARVMDWIVTGPLVYGGSFRVPPDDGIYLAGDSLGFVDPFTGSGMLAAVTTGFLAGRSCARLRPAGEHLQDCRRLLRSQYLAANLFRALLRWGIADSLAWLLPGDELFRLTRPAVNQLI